MKNDFLFGLLKPYKKLSKARNTPFGLGVGRLHVLYAFYHCATTKFFLFPGGIKSFNPKSGCFKLQFMAINKDLLHSVA